MRKLSKDLTEEERIERRRAYTRRYRNNYVHAREDGPATMPQRPPAETTARREVLAEARLRQHPISALLGEPAPGFSALDRRPPPKSLISIS